LQFDSDKAEEGEVVTMTVIEELGNLVRTARRDAAPSVVAIGRHGRGSGFVVAPGRVVTNAHNLRDETTEVRFLDGRAVQGRVAGSDVDGDLVVAELDADLACSLADVSPQPVGDGLVGGDDVDVDLGAGAVAARPAVAGDGTGVVMHEPPVVRRVEAGLAELVTGVVEREVGEPDNGRVMGADERPDRLGIRHRRPAPGPARW